MRIGVSIVLGLTSFLVCGQPRIDTLFRVSVPTPMFTERSPKVLIDEAHNNYHKKETGLFALTRMMEADGAEVCANEKVFTDELLSNYDLLIIVNAIHDSNVGNWQNPCPSAFTEREIDVVFNYVVNGGSLLLVADHMPLGGAVQDLAAKFEIEWSNSFSMRKGNQWPPSVFERTQQTLLSSPVTESTEYSREISMIATFTGSAFKVPDHAIPFLVFDDSHMLLMPEVSWKFKKKTKKEFAGGWYQGACLTYGNGKIVVLGEAAMITAQLRGKTKIGMNSPDASENAQLALNIFRYLAADN